MMKSIAAVFLATFATVTAAQPSDRMSAADLLKSELAEVGPETFTSPAFKPGTLRHIVLFRYKEGTTDTQREEIRRRFLALGASERDGKPYIVSIETGEQNSGEGADGGFEEAFLVTFRSEGDRNYYVGTPIVNEDAYFDPEHDKFKEFVGPFLAEKGVLVFDFAVTATAPWPTGGPLKSTGAGPARIGYG
jgi:hypothetical protein